MTKEENKKRRGWMKEDGKLCCWKPARFKQKAETVVETSEKNHETEGSILSINGLWIWLFTSSWEKEL